MAKFVVYEDRASQWRWRLISDNNVDILADSGEGYTSEDYCRKILNWIRANAAAIPVEPRK